ncbi:unnamed protein product [Prunus armeniaca]|uniref:Transmembrane protein n=1 Tax=Prunus armeniaca TaxID=36596 RepID=A0A6J5XXH0_PRUAR|nr:unnamed protein product [Prunus armeniaca]
MGEEGGRAYGVGWLLGREEGGGLWSLKNKGKIGDWGLVVGVLGYVDVFFVLFNVVAGYVGGWADVGFWVHGGKWWSWGMGHKKSVGEKESVEEREVYIYK